MQRSSERRFAAASSLLLSLSLLISCQSSFASDGLVPNLASPVFGILKVPGKVVSTVLQTGGGVASTVLQTGGSAASAVVKTGSGAASSVSKSALKTEGKTDDTDRVESASNTEALTRDHRSVGRDFPILQGEVSTYQPYTIVSQTINNLVDAGLARDERTATLNKAVNHYGKLHSRIAASAMNSLNFTIPNRGFNPSIEAGNVVTGENMQIKSLAAAELARQKQVDELHVKVVASVMQIAMGMGMSDHVKGQQKVNAEFNSLRTLVGEEDATNTMKALTEWSKHAQLKAHDSAFNHTVWDVNEQREKKLTVMTTALNSDPVVSDVMRRLHKYNQRSKFARVSSRVVQATLGTIALGPDFIGAGGRIALGAFVAATGGPEQDKIMKELYLGERLDSRSHVLNSEIQLAMENYQLGKLTRNAVLMAAAEAVIQQMAGPELLPEVFGKSPEASSEALPAFGPFKKNL